MLWLSADGLELALNPALILVEPLKIIAILIVSLIAIRLLIGWMNKRAIIDLAMNKLKYSVLLTLALSTYFYLDYSLKVYDRFFDERRDSLLAKIEEAKLLAQGVKAEDVTPEEYVLLTEITGWFPQLPTGAKNISFIYTYDGFLPDYAFQLTYEVPLDQAVETIDYKNRSFDKSRSFEIIDNRKVVKYQEGRS